MIYVKDTDTLDVTTSSAASTDVVAAYVTAVSSGLTTPAAGRSAQNSAGAGTVTNVVPAPGSGNTSTLKQLTVRNKDASLSNTVIVRQNVSATAYELHAVTLAPGECLIYTEGVGFFKLGNASPNRLLSSMEGGDTQRVFASHLTQGGTFLTISGTAYYVYIGRAAQDLTVKFVEFHITTAGAGTDTKEVGLFSTPSAPNKSAQTLTKIAATGTVDSGTTTGAKRNTASFAQAVPAGTHLWAAFRGALATTQITALGLANDMSQGRILTTTGGGALTGVTTAAGTIPAIATATVAPALRVTLD